MMMSVSASVDSRRSLAVRVAPADRAASNMAAPGNTARPMTCARKSAMRGEDASPMPCTFAGTQ